MAICVAVQWIIGGLISLPFTFYVSPYCAVPQWLFFYTVLISIIVPALFTLIINLKIFKHVHSSSKRIHPQMTTNTETIIIRQQPAINRRDLYLLKHMIFIFSMFIVGWTPIFSLVAIDYQSAVSQIVYALLQVFSVICFLVCMMDLLLCNQDLKRFIKDTILQCF
ncbi:unnamed protein product [Adineta steineri]|uniref:G-protein coupled receptors family 1 profile domain-containing protein n=1 Tax=Adineta steineri TaxID=433720 RepID=A0A814D212_9BILA|nr:unnamed protein product [Adineta steineri]CAF0948399.1 unnamed protein product [Adineta steineri]CAF3680468.1 unnamed protein product [Adineta steineri]CAF3929162.1 unnamed protein product [Adineta steineri]